MSALWLRLGRLPAVPVVTASVALQALIGLTLSFPMSVVFGLFVALAFIAYCVARPANGWGIFWAGAVPQYGSIILHDAVGLSEWWAYAACIPLAALGGAQECGVHDEQPAADEAGGAPRPAAE